MKSLTLVVLISVFSLQLTQAQRRNITHNKQSWDKQTVFWGYYLGLNMKNFEISYHKTDFFVESTPNIGFNVGLIGDLRLHKNINLRLEPGLSSNTKTLAFNNISGGQKDSIRAIGGTYLHFPLLIKFSTNRYENIRPYLIGGVSYDLNLSSNEGSTLDNEDGEFRTKKHNFMYEIGFGIDFYLPYFIFSPSIRGIFAINNEMIPDDNPNSPWTSPIDFFGTRGIFLNLAFH